MTVAVLFPGQGAHRPGMASAWRDHPAFATFAEVGRAAGLADLDRLADDPDACAATAVAQPAVFAAGLAAWRALTDAGVRADLVAGHSLGEVTAAVACGALSLHDGAVLVAERGRAFADACAATPGAMVAVLGLDAAAVRQAIASVPDAVVANDNGRGQVVVAGPPGAVEAAAAACRDAGGRTRPLDVEGAFHTPAMESAVDRVRSCLSRLEVADPRIPLVSGATAEPTTTAEGIRSNLVDGILATVRWREVQDRLAAEGVRRVVEAGPGGVLRGLARRALDEVDVVAVDSPEAVEQVAGELEESVR